LALTISVHWEHTTRPLMLCGFGSTCELHQKRNVLTQYALGLWHMLHQRPSAHPIYSYSFPDNISPSRDFVNRKNDIKHVLYNVNKRNDVFAIFYMINWHLLHCSIQSGMLHETIPKSVIALIQFTFKKTLIA